MSTLWLVFVLRHSGGGLGSLTSRYVASLSVEEVMIKQDKLMDLEKMLYEA